MPNENNINSKQDLLLFIENISLFNKAIKKYPGIFKYAQEEVHKFDTSK